MNMRSLVGVLFAALAVSGCASGSVLESLPAVDGATAAQIVVVRPSNILVGNGATITVTLDGVAIYELGPGEHAAFAVAPGEHIVGRRYWDFGTMISTVVIQAEPTRTYYFVINVDTNTIQISRVAEADGKAMMAKTTAVEQNAWRGRPWGERH
jgi:hypothetical protein